jgi:large subunit ribosomal protein L14
MIQQETILKIRDNSGAKTVKCIKVLGGFKRKYAYLGDTIIVSVQQLRNRSKVTSKVQKGEVYQALIVKTKIKHKKRDGSTLLYGNNIATLINKKGKPIATRIASCIPKHLRNKNNLKLFAISGGKSVF